MLLYVRCGSNEHRGRSDAFPGAGPETGSGCPAPVLFGVSRHIDDFPMPVAPAGALRGWGAAADRIAHVFRNDEPALPRAGREQRGVLIRRGFKLHGWEHGENSVCRSCATRAKGHSSGRRTFIASPSRPCGRRRLKKDSARPQVSARRVFVKSLQQDTHSKSCVTLCQANDESEQEARGCACPVPEESSRGCPPRWIR
jgi:hypothetical protein